MKKWLCLFLAGVLLLSVTACKKPALSGETGNTESVGGQETDFTGENADYKTKYPVLYQSGEHYAVYMTPKPLELLEYYYIVKDQGGRLIDQGIKDYRGSFGFSYRNGLLVMDYGHGTFLRDERYYDVQSGRVSDFFPDPVANSDTLVAYFSVDSDRKITLTVQDIFDESAYIVQIPGPYSDWVFKDAGSYKGEFLEDDTKLKFTYPIGDKGETVTETVTLPGRSPEDRQLLQVLRGEKPFTAENGRTVCLQDYKVCSSRDAVVEKYAWVDLDGDGVNELVAYMTPDLAYLVFHIANGQIYGFEIGIRSLMSLKADGTHVGSGGAGIHSYYKRSFRDGKCETTELAYACDYPDQLEYRVGGKSVTAEKFAVFYEEFKNKPDAAWYPYTGPAQINSLYADFLAGKTTALENGVEKTLESYFSRFSLSNHDWKYAFLDMSGDGVVELCVKRFELYVFTVKDGRVQHWYTDTNTYTNLLNNGDLLMERHGGGPTHINYAYYTLDENGKETFRIYFSWWDGKTVEKGKIYPDRYFVNKEEVTREEYEEKIGKYLEIGQDKIVWYHGD